MNNMKKSMLYTFQEWLEKNIFPFLLVILVTISIGSIVTVVPLFVMDNTLEDAQKFEELRGVRPYTPLELAGRDIYIREGCYGCHSQMIRPFRDELLRYGHYSLAVESRYDHPFQWGSRRTGPDLARVGGKYSDELHIIHFRTPRAVVPESNMPAYPWLEKTPVDYEILPTKMKALRMVGVPYTDEQIQNASESVKGKSEVEALIAYLQSLGTMIKFEEGKSYRE
ncbi:MAG: cytochrome-c oxidase, cbb3-type subunit II [Nitrospinota bacterium]